MLLVAFILGSGLLSASSICTSGTMDTTGGNYQSSGFSCTIGTIEFSSFSLIVNESGPDFSSYSGPSSISVTPNLTNSAFSFGINPPSWGNNDVVNFIITLTALETDGSKQISALGSSFNDNIVFDDEGSATLANHATCASGCLSTNDFADTSSTAGPSNPILGTGLSGPITLIFEVDMTMSADSSNFTQIIHFSEMTATIGDSGTIGGGPAPEPATVGFVGLGVAGLLLRARQRSRRNA